jgi:hypothetical protein
MQKKGAVKRPLDHYTECTYAERNYLQSNNLAAQSETTASNTVFAPVLIYARGSDHAINI